MTKRCPEAHLFHINASNLDSPFHIILKDRESSQSVPNNICCFDLERMWNYRRTKELIYPKGLSLVLLVLLQTVSQKEFFPAVTTLLYVVSIDRTVILGVFRELVLHILTVFFHYLNDFKLTYSKEKYLYLRMFIKYNLEIKFKTRIDAL